MVKVTKRKAPSRAKYEQSHPTVSGRVTLEIHQRLQVVKKTEGKSIADIIMIGLGLLEVKVSQEKEAKQQGYEKGHNDGFKEARDYFMIRYKCSVCGEVIAVMDQDTKEAIKEYLLENGWGHADCIDNTN